MRILYATSEATPFAKSGGLADVAGALPKALVQDGVDARVIMPLYGDLGFRDHLEYVTNYSVPVGWRSQYCGLFTAQWDGVTYYFLDNEYYFKRRGLYGFYDDGERFAFFSRAVLETLFYLDFTPDIINCNDWQTALVPVYLNLYYRHLDKFNRIKTIFTIHNIAYQGKYGLEILEDTCGIGRRDQHIVEYDGCANFMKGAFETADKITTVSPTYAQEILDPWFSYGLDALLREKQYKLCGILNGIDMEANNPATDPSIPYNYSTANFREGKAACKAALQDQFGLHKDGSPVFAIVSRMVGMKGFDLVQSIADGLVDLGIELVILGSGESQYEGFFSDLAARRPGRVGTYIGFNSALAQQIYAGADCFLMPSKSEPCGLAQMVACRYGTPPIVRETGGLRDSIQDSTKGHGNGFTFAGYSAHELYDACCRANAAYYDKENWEHLVEYAMNCDFSWSVSAKSYEGLYNDPDSGDAQTAFHITKALPQKMNIVIQIAFLHFCIRAPHPGEDHQSGQHCIRISQKYFQKPTFPFGEGKLSLLRGKLPKGNIIAQIAQGQNLGSYDAAGTAAYGADPRHEFFKGKRFHNVIICAAVQSLDPVIEFPQSSEQDHRGFDVIGPGLLQGHEAVHGGQHPVQDDQIVGILQHQIQSVPSIVAEIHGEAFLFQLIGQYITEVFVILDQ